jgi:hypothetical protein
MKGGGDGRGLGCRPDNPEDLRTVGLDVDRVAEEWREP